jgi:hypothetical protein
MLNYDVFVHPAEGYEAIKHGFSWPAFLFGVFWAFYKKLWLPGLIYLALMLGLGVSSGGLENDGLIAFYDLVGLAVSFVVGASGNAWQRQALLAGGYRHIDRVAAASAKDAIQCLYRHDERSPV